MRQEGGGVDAIHGMGKGDSPLCFIQGRSFKENRNTRAKKPLRTISSNFLSDVSPRDKLVPHREKHGQTALITVKCFKSFESVRCQSHRFSAF